MKERNSDIASVLLGGSDLIDEVIKDHLKERKIVLNSTIDECIVENVVLHILKFNAEDKGKEISTRKPIMLYINSLGGEVSNGGLVIDVIRNSKTPVMGVAFGYVYSMGAMIFMNCHKRYMFENSSMLIHDGNQCVSGTSNKVKDLQKFYKKMDDRIKQMVIDNSNITSEEYDENLDRELYMYADDCKENGLCDFIIGIDVEMDDII